LEAAHVIASLLGRWLGARTDARELDAMRSEVEKLRAQNASMKSAMRHCIDCEYRLDVVARRGEQGLSADGSVASDPSRAEG